MVNTVENLQQQNEAKKFESNIERATNARREFAGYLSEMSEALVAAEAEGKENDASGRLGFDQDIADLNQVSENLRQGLFRLLVLGDMKRGKSTFLNALIGERVLPTKVNPCTAVLTKVRYGNNKQVIVNYNDGKASESIDFQTFEQRFTIPPDEAKKFEKEEKDAFPDVDYATIEYPLEILKNGVEFIDSPGLNDTEQRNKLALGYINNCHAILFVLSGKAQFTMNERRYLENYLKDKGLTTFFLINYWNYIRESLFDPEDEQELAEAENNVRQHFKTNLLSYCQVNGKNLYNQRVFELNALAALRACVKNKSLKGTGFDKFIPVLDTFLTEERIIAELLKVKTLARQTYQHVHESVGTRITLLDKGVEELREQIKAVQPEFNQLVEIRDGFKNEIHSKSEDYANSLADDFYRYLSNLSNTLETDFAPYQPNLKVFDLLKGGKRKEFEQKLEHSFKQYFNDKMAAWTTGAEKKLKEAFSQLAQSAEMYGDAYSQITDQISAKLTGAKIETVEVSSEDKSPGWTRWAGAAAGLLTGNPAGAALVGLGALNWKSLVTQVVAMVVANGILIYGFGAILGPLGIALVPVVTGPFQLAAARNKLIKTAKAEMKKSLPKIAKEQAWNVYNAVKEIFDNFESGVTQRINGDVQSRKTELEELLAQKESKEIDRKAEVDRLNALDQNVFNQWNAVEAAHDKLLEETTV